MKFKFYDELMQRIIALVQLMKLHNQLTLH
jgi:hypothetical protein